MEIRAFTLKNNIPSQRIGLTTYLVIELLQSLSQSSQASIEISTVVKTKHIKYTTQPGGYYNSIILRYIYLPGKLLKSYVFPGNHNSGKNVQLDTSHINEIIVAQQSYESLKF